MQKTVWLLGDSLRMGFEPYLRDARPDWNIVSPPENCRFAAYMLNSLRFWLPSMGKPDVIHFNGTLWDTACLFADDGPFTPLEEYVRRIKSIARELKRCGVPVIFATGTPVNAEDIRAVATPRVDDPDGATVFKQDNARIHAYNDAAARALSAQGVLINDLYPLIDRDRAGFIGPDGIHMTEEGYKVLAGAVERSIASALSDAAACAKENIKER